MNSVQQKKIKTLENYDGEIRIEYTETVFSVSVIIPYIN
jgi:hypothetical protein